MKTTSYEISKKLFEIGFKAPSDKKHEKSDGSGRITHLPYPAYDLETILEALPQEIQMILSQESGNCLIYDAGSVGEIFLEQKGNECLADTAARLLILLHEKGIVNFNTKK